MVCVPSPQPCGYSPATSSADGASSGFKLTLCIPQAGARTLVTHLCGAFCIRAQRDSKGGPAAHCGQLTHPPPAPCLPASLPGLPNSVSYFLRSSPQTTFSHINKAAQRQSPYTWLVFRAHIGLDSPISSLLLWWLNETL